MNRQPVDFKAVAAKGAYVYCYLRANGRPYYVGIASQGQYRRPFERHSCKPPTKQRHLARVMRSGLTLEEARRWERFYIAKFGRKGYEQNGILLNQGEGGEGGTAGIKWSPEIVEKRAAAMRGKSQRKRTPEEIEALRQRMLGTKQSAETRAKRSASSKGHKKSDETRARMSAAWTGTVRTEKSKRNQAITNAAATAEALGLNVLDYIALDRSARQRVNRAFAKGVRGEGLLVAARTIGRRALSEIYKQYAAA